MNSELLEDIAAIQEITAIPLILETVAAVTGLRFVCVARVDEQSWTACAVLDRLEFGVEAGDSLDIATTLCEQVRATRQAVVIDEVATDARYRDHQAPRNHGFQSYISVPLIRPDGSYFGTLCGLDPLPAQLSGKATVSSLTLYAELISRQLAVKTTLEQAQVALHDAQDTAELREQFIAVLGHDLRNPLNAIMSGVDLLGMLPDAGPTVSAIVARMRRSALRISGLVDDVMDLTRGRIGSGIVLTMRDEVDMNGVLEQVVAELRAVHPDRHVIQDINIPVSLYCDSARIAQLLSNLLKNALVHGNPDKPVAVQARMENGIFELSVSNEGPALSPEVMAQLFKPFWRGAPVAAGQGLGLGLFIVSEIARSHKGDIDVFSSVTGTCFMLTLKTPAFRERRNADCGKGWPEPDRRRGSRQ